VAEVAPVEPMVLSGPPSAIRGRTSMSNSTDQRVSVQGGDLHVAGRESVPVRVGVILPPGAEAVVPLRLDLGATTPPGIYTGSLEIAGIARPVHVHVDTVVALDIAPDSLVLDAGSHELTVQVRNTGNVGVPLAPLVRSHTRPHDATDERSGPEIELRYAGRRTLLGPGEEARLDVTVVVPDALDPTRRHEAVLPIGPADLAVTVLPRPGRNPSARSARTSTGSAPTASPSRTPRTRVPRQS
jgi:hypothetical protein